MTIVKKKDWYYWLVALLTIQDIMPMSLIFRDIYRQYFKYPILMIVSLIIFILTVSGLKMSKNELCIWIALLPLLLISANIYDQNCFLYLAALCILSEKSDINETVKVIFRVTLIFFILHFLIFCFYFFVNPIYTFPYISDNGDIRYSIYFDHFNNASRIFLFGVIQFLFIYWDRIKKWYWIIITIASVVMYYLTKSDALILVIIIFFYWKYKDTDKIKKINNFILKYGIVFFTFISLSKLWSQWIPGFNILVDKINELATGRLNSNINSLNLYGITLLGKDSLFGKEFVYNGKEYSYIYCDNMYVYFLVHWGAIYLVIFAAFLVYAKRYINVRKMFPILIMLLFGLVENRIDSINVYFCILIVVDAIKNLKVKDIKKIK